MQPTDAELVALALSGSEEGYRCLAERFERPVFSILVRMVRDRALAEDLAQDAFVKAFRNLHRFDCGRKFSSWLFKIAHNTAIDHLRRKQLDIVPLERTSRDQPAAAWEVVAASENEHPDRLVEHSELASGIEAALGTLRPAYRAILVLRFQEELSYEEISEVMDLPMGTVKVQLHRARKQLARVLTTMGWDVSR